MESMKPTTNDIEILITKITKTLDENSTDAIIRRCSVENFMTHINKSLDSTGKSKLVAMVMNIEEETHNTKQILKDALIALKALNEQSNIETVNEIKSEPTIEVEGHSPIFTESTKPTFPTEEDYNQFYWFNPDKLITF